MYAHFLKLKNDFNKMVKHKYFVETMYRNDFTKCNIVDCCSKILIYRENNCWKTVCVISNELMW